MLFKIINKQVEARLASDTSLICVFSHFEHISTSNAHGGAIQMVCDGGTARFNSSLFFDCHTSGNYYGGGVDVERSSMSAFATCFISCSANDNGSGMAHGRVTSTYAPYSRMDTCLFFKCGRKTAFQDAAFNNLGLTMSIRNLNSTDNLCTNEGSHGTWYTPTDGAPLELHFSNFVNGQASSTYQASGSLKASHLNYIACANPVLQISSNSIHQHIISSSSFVECSGFKITGTLTLYDCMFTHAISVSGLVITDEVDSAPIINTQPVALYTIDEGCGVISSNIRPEWRFISTFFELLLNE